LTATASIPLIVLQSVISETDPASIISSAMRSSRAFHLGCCSGADMFVGLPFRDEEAAKGRGNGDAGPGELDVSPSTLMTWDDRFGRLAARRPLVCCLTPLALLDTALANPSLYGASFTNLELWLTWAHVRRASRGKLLKSVSISTSRVGFDVVSSLYPARARLEHHACLQAMKGE
jgi:hypothetical protein